MSEAATVAATGMTRRRWRPWILAWIALMVVAVVAFLVVLRLHPAYTASIEGLTESIELQALTREQHWTLKGFVVASCPGRASLPVLEGQTFIVRPPALVRFEKLEDSATVRIDVSSLGGKGAPGGCEVESPVDVVRADGDRQRIRGSHVVFTREYKAGADQTWYDPAAILPVHGTMIVGEELGEGVDRMLLSGTVTMHADQSERFFSKMLGTFRKTTYVGESVALARGDRILPTVDQKKFLEDGKPTAGPDPSATGYVRVSAKGPLQFGLIEPTQSVTIQRAGIATVEVDMSFWQRLQNEPALTTLIAFMVALIAVVELRDAFAVPFEKWHAED